MPEINAFGTLIPAGRSYLPQGIGGELRVVRTTLDDTDMPCFGLRIHSRIFLGELGNLDHFFITSTPVSLIYSHIATAHPFFPLFLGLGGAVFLDLMLSPCRRMLP